MPAALLIPMWWAVYVLAARAALAVRAVRARGVFFAAVNLTGVLLFYYTVAQQGVIRLEAGRAFAAYLAGVVLFYGTLRWARADFERRFPAAVLFPIVFLVLVKLPALELGAVFVGVSFMAFRLSYLVVEVRNGAVEFPTWWELLGFAFFVPTMAVGPINAYRNYIESYRDHAVPPGLVRRALFRIVVGAAKFSFLANLCHQLSFSGLWFDGNDHTAFDFVLSSVAYYLYLYANFSGFCDMMVGMSGLLGIRVTENFDNPFAARNVKDFWNRWHITLSTYMQEMVFNPLSKYLAAWTGGRGVNHCIAAGILVTFGLIGIWHGVGWNFLLFGLYHGIGVVAVHYYTLWLKKRLGKRLLAYNHNRWIRAAAIVVTFFYVSLSFFFFENVRSDMVTVIAAFPGSLREGGFRLW